MPPEAGRAWDDAADRRAALGLVPVSRETADHLARYVALLRRWQDIKNLVAPSTLDRIWTRHIADSAQLVALAPDARRWVDLGSGAGFPGLVVAVMQRDLPGMRVDLVESNDRKCAFLREVARATAAPAQVRAGRIEDVVPRLGGGIDVVSSRALAPVRDLIALSQPLLDQGATGLFLTGEADNSDSLLPLESAYSIETVPSLTQAGARILKIRARRGRDHEG